MKLKRFIIALLTISLLLTLASCKKDDNDEEERTPDTSEDEKEAPENETEGDGSEDVGDGTQEEITDGGDETDEGGDGNGTSEYYVYSTKGEKFHLPDCRYAVDLKDDTRVEYSGDVDFLISTLRLEPCKICKPLPTEDEENVEPEVIPEGTTYILNEKTMLFHELDCYSAANMNEENKVYTTREREELIQAGYKACDNCNVKDY